MAHIDLKESIGACFAVIAVTFFFAICGFGLGAKYGKPWQGIIFTATPFCILSIKVLWQYLPFKYLIEKVRKRRL